MFTRECPCCHKTLHFKDYKKMSLAGEKETLSCLHCKNTLIKQRRLKRINYIPIIALLIYFLPLLEIIELLDLFNTQYYSTLSSFILLILFMLIPILTFIGPMYYLFMKLLQCFKRSHDEILVEEDNIPENEKTEAQKHLDHDNHKEEKKINSLMLLAIGLSVIFGAILFYFSGKINNIVLTKYLISTPHGVILNVENSFVKTDSNGHFIEQRFYDELGLRSVADIAYFNNSMLVIDYLSNQVKHCDIAPFSKCSVVTELNFETNFTLYSASQRDFNLAITPNKKFFYLSHKNEDSQSLTFLSNNIYKYRADGTFLYQLKTEELDSANTFIAQDDGTLIFSDTNNKRILALKDISKNITKILWELDAKTAKSTNILKDYRYFPTVVKQNLEDKRLWVINKDSISHKKDVIVFDKPLEGDSILDIDTTPSINNDTVLNDNIDKQNLDKRFEQDYFYPMHWAGFDDLDLLEPHQKGMLFVDSKTFTVLFFDQFVHYDKPFLDKTTTSLLDNVKSKKEYLKILYYSVMLLMIIANISIFYVFYLEYKRVKNREQITIKLTENESQYKTYTIIIIGAFVFIVFSTLIYLYTKFTAL
jgi:hypothetical protein